MKKCICYNFFDSKFRSVCPRIQCVFEHNPNKKGVLYIHCMDYNGLIILKLVCYIQLYENNINTYAFLQLHFLPRHLLYYNRSLMYDKKSKLMANINAGRLRIH